MPSRLRTRLEQLLRPITIITVRDAPRATLPLLGSHFGGVPYLERGEPWPRCASCGAELTCICQLDLREGWHAPIAGLALVSFFYCWECRPGWHRDDPSERGEWALRCHSAPRADAAAVVEPPEPVYTITPSAVDIAPGVSLPDLDNVADYLPDLYPTAGGRVAERQFVEAYNRIADELAPGRWIFSFIGGYSAWQNFISPPRCRQCDALMSLVVQIASEANISWGDIGNAHIYRCPVHPTSLELVVEST